MQIVQYFSDGSMVFNWEQLPEGIRKRTDLRDKIFKELQGKVKLGENITSQVLCDLNRYAVDRIRNEFKK